MVEAKVEVKVKKVSIALRLLPVFTRAHYESVLDGEIALRCRNRPQALTCFHTFSSVLRIDEKIREIREDLYGGIARHIGLGKAGTILISRCGGEDVNQLRREFASEIGHEIVYQERGLDVSPSVDEFYDAVARLIVDPYSQDIVNEYASVGEKSLNSEPLRDDDLDLDARNYIRRRGVPAHHEGLAIYRRLLRIFGKDLPKIAGKALRNPRIDFSNPNSFYKSVIKEYQGDEK